MRLRVTKEEKLETVKRVQNDVEIGKDISLHDVWLILEYSLEYVDNKRDLTDSEIMTIRNIREAIKGL